MNNSRKINFKAVLIGELVDIGGTLLVVFVLAFVMVLQGIPAADIEATILAWSNKVSVLVIYYIIGLSFTFWGGFIGARIAKSAEIMHSGIIGVIGVVLGLFSLQSSTTHLWLNIIAVILNLPVAMLGGYVAQGRNIREQSLLGANEKSAKWPNMFKELTNLGYQRSAKEAFGFYIAYLLLAMFSCVIMSNIVGIILKDSNINLALRIGSITAVIVSIGLSFFVLKEKKLLGNFGFILLALLSGLLALKIGGMGGLIPVAYLTSKPVNAKRVTA